MPLKILIVDDDPAIAEMITYNLNLEGFQTIVAYDGQEGIRKFYAERPDLVVLDITMPKIDGFEVCRRIREMAETPIIMLTAQGREESVVHGLDVGADVYVVKPFKIKEFMARVRSNLRRASLPPAAQEIATYADEFLTVDLPARRVTVNGEIIKLTPTEYKLLALLVKNKGRVLEFRQLLEQVWGFEYINDVDYLRVYIWHLRRKVEPDPKNPTYLRNELSTGYRFDPRR